MATATDIKQRIEAPTPDAHVDVEDWTGGGDHFRATVVSPAFGGKTRIEQHRMVYAVFGNEIGGPIHAPSLTTKAEGHERVREPSARRDRRGDPRQRRDPVHEGCPRGARVRLLGA